MKYEYKIEFETDAGESYLNTNGAYGWELVAVLPIDIIAGGYQYIWKRVKVNN